MNKLKPFIFYLSAADSEDITCDRDTFILYVIFLSVLSTVVVLMFIIIITLSVCSCIVNRKKKKGKYSAMSSECHIVFI